MEYMSRKKDQNGISNPRMTLTGILKFDEGTKSEYSDPNWNIWGSKALIGISPNVYTAVLVATAVYTVVGSFGNKKSKPPAVIAALSQSSAMPR